MARRPETKYAWNGDVALAYQVFGEGPVDLVYLQGWSSHVDLNWESPALARFLRGLGRHARVIHTDRRGWGCSDRFSPGDVAPLEVQADDLVAVMDAAGSERAVVFGSWDTCLASMLFAATYPERCAGLVLCDPMVTWVATEATPWMYSEEHWEQICDEVHATWGTGAWFADHEPVADARELEWIVPFSRASVSPGALVAETRAFYRVDVRGVLPSIHVPTLVVGDPGDPDLLPVLLGMVRGNAGFIAQRIPGSRLVEPDGREGAAWFHWYGRAPVILEEVGRLVAGIKAEQDSLDRVLATVLFTDIVDSTTVAARLGDRGWRELVERHHATVRGLLARYRGVEVDTAGDGFFATFDGPARAARCAGAIVGAMAPLGIQVRAGLHTGEVETIAGKAGGMAVVIGARVGALAGPSEVLASRTVKELTVGSGLVFEDAGERELKGVPDRWPLYRVTSPAP